MEELRDQGLFSPQHIKAQFLKLLATCATPDERTGYLRRVGYYGCVGDGGDITADRATAEYWVARLSEERVNEPQIQALYTMCLNYFRHWPPKAQRLVKTLDCFGSFASRANEGEALVPDRTFLYVGRADSATDRHYALRCRLYGFTEYQIANLPFSGVCLKKRCQFCDSEQWPLTPCRLCRDVYYCGKKCERHDAPDHAAYCAQSVEAQCASETVSH